MNAQTTFIPPPFLKKNSKAFTLLMESGADRKIKKKLLLKSFKKGYKKITTSKKYKEKVKKKKKNNLSFDLKPFARSIRMFFTTRRLCLRLKTKKKHSALSLVY